MDRSSSPVSIALASEKRDVTAQLYSFGRLFEVSASMFPISGAARLHDEASYGKLFSIHIDLLSAFIACLFELKRPE